MTSVEASRKENENKVWRRKYLDFGGDTWTPQFLVSDNVRIMTKKRIPERLHAKMDERGF